MNLAEKIIANCVEEGGCLIWQGSCSPPGSPQMRWDGKPQKVRRLIYTAMTGRNVARVSTRCKTPGCVEPACLCESNPSREQKGKRKAPSHRMAIIVARRARSKLSDQQASEIRASDAPGVALAELYGVSPQMVSLIRLNRFRRDFSSPFAGLTF